MPEKLEKKLKLQAIKKRMSKNKANAYIYGTMRKTGWRPKTDGNKHS